MSKNNFGEHKDFKSELAAAARESGLNAADPEQGEGAITRSSDRSKKFQDLNKGAEIPKEAKESEPKFRKGQIVKFTGTTIDKVRHWRGPSGNLAHKISEKYRLVPFDPTWNLKVLNPQIENGYVIVEPVVEEPEKSRLNESSYIIEPKYLN